MPEPRLAVQRMAPYSPPSAGRAGKLRLDFNENTCGASPRVVEALQRYVAADALAVYPEYVETKPVLARHFLQAVGQVYRRDDVRLSADAVTWLMQQPWPGNVRQLRQHIERTVLVSDSPALEARHFQASGDMEPRDADRDVLPPVGSMTMDELEKAMILKSLRHHQGNISRVAQALGLSRAALYRRLEKYEIPV